MRLSYTFLSLWSKGRIDEALGAYFHSGLPPTQQQLDGLAHHKKWEEEIIQKKKLHIGKSIYTFSRPCCEYRITVPYSEDFTLTGILDCLDVEAVYEFKSGTKSSLEYAETHQLPFYFLLCELSGLEVDRGLLIHYNQYEDTSDLTIVRNTRRQIEKARNLIDTIGGEAREYFIQHKLPLDTKK
jgi:hypothetical protein